MRITEWIPACAGMTVRRGKDKKTGFPPARE
jgi:hypothetical protein